MKVLIVGAGEVGFHIAQRLSEENKDVFLIARSLFDDWIKENDYRERNGEYVVTGNTYKLVVAKKE